MIVKIVFLEKLNKTRLKFADSLNFVNLCIEQKNCNFRPVLFETL